MSAYPVPRRGASIVAVMVLVLVLASGCSTGDIDKIPQEFGGLPAGAPARPAQAPAYPAVHDMPPQRAATVLDAEQQRKLETDLIAIRNRQPNQQKNIAREKAKAQKAAKAKAAKDNRRPGTGRQSVPGATGPAPGAPPWPVPPQTTGGSPRP